MSGCDEDVGYHRGKMMIIMMKMLAIPGGRWVKGVAKVVTCPALIACGCLRPSPLYNAARENLPQENKT